MPDTPLIRALIAAALGVGLVAPLVLPTAAQQPRYDRNDAYRPPAGAPVEPFGGGYGAPPAQPYGSPPAYGTPPPYGAPPAAAPPGGVYYPPQAPAGTAGGYGAPPPGYSPPPRFDGPPPVDPRYADQRYGTPYGGPPPQLDGPRTRYDDLPPPAAGPRRAAPTGDYSAGEISEAGRNFFGSISQGMASAVEYVFRRQGRPNGYILGEEAGGAFIGGLRYGEGTLYTRDAGTFKVYWQGPSIGFDAGGEGNKVMVLVYGLRDPGEIFDRFGGVNGSAYVVGGVGVTFQSKDHITLAPIRAGIGLRLGAAVGYLKYSRKPTWNPF